MTYHLRDKKRLQSGLLVYTAFRWGREQGSRSEQCLPLFLTLSSARLKRLKADSIHKIGRFGDLDRADGYCINRARSETKRLAVAVRGSSGLGLSFMNMGCLYFMPHTVSNLQEFARIIYSLLLPSVILLFKRLSYERNSPLNFIRAPFIRLFEMTQARHNTLTYWTYVRAVGIIKLNLSLL